MGRKYEKHPTHFCKPCHKTFKSKRALKAHNNALHAPKPVPEEHGLADGGDLPVTDRRCNPVRDGTASDLIIIDEAAEIDPDWFEKL